MKRVQKFRNKKINEQAIAVLVKALRKIIKEQQNVKANKSKNGRRSSS